METKTCVRCKEELPLEAFHRNKNKRDGLAIYCRTCASWLKQNPQNPRENFPMDSDAVPDVSVLNRLSNSISLIHVVDLGIKPNVSNADHVQSRNQKAPNSLKAISAALTAAN